MLGTRRRDYRQSITAEVMNVAALQMMTLVAEMFQMQGRERSM